MAARCRIILCKNFQHKLLTNNLFRINRQQMADYEGEYAGYESEDNHISFDNNGVNDSEAKIRAACIAAADFFRTQHGKVFYDYLVYEVCHAASSCLDVDNALRMAAHCAQQSIGFFLQDIYNQKFTQ